MKAVTPDRCGSLFCVIFMINIITPVAKKDQLCYNMRNIICNIRWFYV